ncbi:hypothetical protein CY34DRAFT_804354 [Suillus luteus UH-Slu-Lm8-n1]|uniref:Uncharacterized protein n=1 Tax=Suillus luteus UH-Slu-Lm8-n1 TaxID=930992 RepID=A0A0C9ZZ43_9AGAM|nr:hypothetical protein CY34DRAFT_804354 [Suillus luteus UH-Slu-Lm8-n1]
MKSRVGVRAKCPNLTQIKQCLLGTKVLLKDARFALPTPFPSIRASRRAQYAISSGKVQCAHKPCMSRREPSLLARLTTRRRPTFLLYYLSTVATDSRLSSTEPKVIGQFGQRQGSRSRSSYWSHHLGWAASPDDVPRDHRIRGKDGDGIHAFLRFVSCNSLFSD